ncbi:hypothetical protein LCGC14_0364520 [marine sediment metagenome]|uniref:Uncharacterized protein n=1 Tax=marine sediment metagenome TaxID=412755 RepID=A0A0F9T6W9_9ZZZZ
MNKNVSFYQQLKPYTRSIKARIEIMNFISDRINKLRLSYIGENYPKKNGDKYLIALRDIQELLNDTKK